MTLSLKQKEKFYRNREKVNKVILKNIRRKKHIVHGQRALNRILPAFLDTKTSDWDVFSDTPQKTARRVERKLDKRFGGDFFRTEESEITKDVYKVRSNVTGKTVADYSKAKRPVPTRNIRGVRYATKEHFKRQIKENLVNPEKEFRRAKDIDQLNRIQVSERLREQKKRTREPTSFLELLSDINRRRFF